MIRRHLSLTRATRFRRTLARGLGTALWTSTLVVLGFVVLSSDARAGVVALQSADPSCADDSGDFYVDCGNGTVTDNRTGLVWLANADCIGDEVDWFTAMDFVAGLSDVSADSVGADFDCGLSDGSKPGEWRLPSVDEWEAMIANALGQDGDPDCLVAPPTITNDGGEGCWIDGPSSFSNVVSPGYWSSTTPSIFPTAAYSVSLLSGTLIPIAKVDEVRHAWPVRAGQ